MKRRFLWQILLSIIITLLLLGVVVFICNGNKLSFSWKEIYNTDYTSLWTYYEKNIRGNLFAGLLSVGGFLMTGKTFILVTMKQNVFDDSEYIENFEKMVKHNKDMKRYDPLIELKDALYLSVYVTIVASVIQLTIGLIPFWYMALFSIFTAILSVVLVIDSLNLIKRNLDFWLNEKDH